MEITRLQDQIMDRLTRQKSHFTLSCWMTSNHIMTNRAKMLSDKYLFQEHVELTQAMGAKQFACFTLTVATFCSPSKVSLSLVSVSFPPPIPCSLLWRVQEVETETQCRDYPCLGSRLILLIVLFILFPFSSILHPLLSTYPNHYHKAGYICLF